MKLLAIIAVMLAVLIPGSGSAAPTPVSHVVLIMLENKPVSVLPQMAYLNGLSNTYGKSTNQYAVGYPSLPNYMALTGGLIPSGINGKDCLPKAPCVSSGDNIFHQLGANWAVWAESMTGNCVKQNQGTLYAVRHTAAPYYTDLTNCAQFDRPLNAASPPAITAGFTLVAPNMCNDAHSCSAQTADKWLSTFMPKLMADPAYQDGSTLIEITFDSGNHNCGSTCPSQVPLIFVNPSLNTVVVSAKATHYSTLRLNEELLGLPLLGNAKTAVDIRGALGL